MKTGEVDAGRPASGEAGPMQEEDRGLIGTDVLIVEVCRIYADTKEFYEKTIVPQLKSAALGFRVLYGPPVINAPYLFLGYQPGGGTKDFDESQHIRWPEKCVYASRCWPLAKQICLIWDKALVEQCTGLNAIFFRSPNIKAWKSLKSGIREPAEQFSLLKAEKLIRLLRPQRIVIVGLGTVDMLPLKHSKTVFMSAKGRPRRVLVKGELWGLPAFGIIHLSGARLSKDDMCRLKNFFAEPNK